jgi:hypothetical protein
MDFDHVINEHRELQRRNARLEQTRPLERYRAQVPSRDDLPFDGQAEAADEETRDLSLARLTGMEPPRDADSRLLWDIPPLFESDD